jgi:hypothetical protein
MRKHASFAAAALAITLTAILFATSNVIPSSADNIHPKAGTPHGASVGSFLPAKALEPAW